MEQEAFKKIARALSVALVDDFRGFLVEGTKRVEVPDDMLHLQIAYQELLKVPGWKYESGTGQNPIVEYLQIKKAIYITKILKEDGSGYQRTVGYLTDIFSEKVEYRGEEQYLYEILRSIAIGMGYDVDEYTLQMRTENSVKTPTTIVTYKGETHIKKQYKEVEPHRTLSEGDKPIFSNNGQLMGFISNGKFVRAKEYKRYATFSSTNKEEQNNSHGKSR